MMTARLFVCWTVVLGISGAVRAQEAVEEASAPRRPRRPPAARPSHREALPAVPLPPPKAPFVPVHAQIRAPAPPGEKRKRRRFKLRVQPNERPFHILQEHIELPPAPPTVPLPYSDHLLGTWDDLRPALEHDGFRPSLTFVSDLAGNPVGGVHKGFTEADNLGFALYVDLERLWGLQGARLDLSMNQRSGSSLSHSYIENVFNVQEVFGGSTYRLVNLDYEQSLCDHRFDVRVGRIAAGDEFLSSPYYWLFVQNGIDGNPNGIFFNAPGMTAYPTETWGLRLKTRPIEELYVMTGFYNGDPNLGLNIMHGVDFTLQGPLFWITEIGYQPNQGRDATGLPGNYKLGVYYNGGPFTAFAPPGGAMETLHGNYGVYFLADQVIYGRGPSDRRQEVGVFGSFLFAPDPRINTMPFFFNGGLVLSGLVPSRPRDYAGFGIVFGQFSPDLDKEQCAEQATNPSVGVQHYEMVLEWTYSFHVAPGMRVQPDLQYIINPGAAGQIPNTLVLGLQVSFNF